MAQFPETLPPLVLPVMSTLNCFLGAETEADGVSSVLLAALITDVRLRCKHSDEDVAEEQAAAVTHLAIDIAFWHFGNCSGEY
jgi:hypothetical protein